MYKPNVIQSATMEQILPAFARFALLEALPILALENATTARTRQMIGHQKNTKARIPKIRACCAAL